MPVYDVTLKRRDRAAREIEILRVSAVNAHDAAVKAIEFATQNHASWADATGDNTDAKPVARN